jgi:hypothetical protein
MGTDQKRMPRLLEISSFLLFLSIVGTTVFGCATLKWRTVGTRELPVGPPQFSLKVQGDKIVVESKSLCRVRLVQKKRDHRGRTVANRTKLGKISRPCRKIPKNTKLLLRALREAPEPEGGELKLLPERRARYGRGGFKNRSLVSLGFTNGKAQVAILRAVPKVWIGKAAYVHVSVVSASYRKRSKRKQFQADATTYFDLSPFEEKVAAAAWAARAKDRAVCRAKWARYACGRLTTFARRFPKSDYAKQASSLVEDSLWANLSKFRARCRDKGDAYACRRLKSFARYNAKSKYAAEAKELVAKADKKRDEMAWGKAGVARCKRPKSSRDCRGVRRYTYRFRKGKHIDEAKALLKKMGPRLDRLAKKEERLQAREYARQRREDKRQCLGDCRSEYKECQRSCSGLQTVGRCLKSCRNSFSWCEQKCARNSR